MSEISPLVRLVDDDDAFRESQKLFLSMCGYKVRDWADPVRFLKEDDPRVPGCLVLDIRMPGMTGLELQRALYVRGNKLPIIFLTGHGDIETAVYTLKYGAVDFFEKRGDPLKLRESVSKACERSQQYWRKTKEEERLAEMFNSLTNREKDVIVLAAKGASNREIGNQLGIGHETVKMHCSNAYGKLGVRSRLEAYQWLQNVPGDVFKEKAP